MHIHYYTSGSPSTSPFIHIAHANGFPPEVYKTFAHQLTTLLPETHTIAAMPARPLWESPPSPQEFDSWHIMADDLITGIEAHCPHPLIGIGHSMGGVATMLASIKRPDLFLAVIMIDPVIIPRWFLRIFGGLRFIGFPLQFPLTKAALRRRRRWESRQAAFERFRSRSLFSRWSDELVWAYIDGLTAPVDNTSEAIELRYVPEWEAQIYETVPTDIWKYVPRISVPTTVIHGVESDTFRPRSVRLWHRLRPDLPVVSIPEAGHLVPVEAPELTAQHTAQFIQQLHLHPVLA